VILDDRFVPKIYHSPFIGRSSYYFTFYNLNKIWKSLLNNNKSIASCSKNVIAFLRITQVTNATNLFVLLHISFFLALSFSLSLFAAVANPELSRIPISRLTCGSAERERCFMCAARSAVRWTHYTQRVSAVTRQDATTGPSVRVSLYDGLTSQRVSAVTRQDATTGPSVRVSG
jgi:hypothetical protein